MFLVLLLDVEMDGLLLCLAALGTSTSASSSGVRSGDKKSELFKNVHIFIG
jgi:hypothetical protein